MSQGKPSPRFRDDNSAKSKRSKRFNESESSSSDSEENKSKKSSDLSSKDWIPITEVPPFPFDLIKMKIRNRKLLNSLNTKCRFKDFEYKNYDSTDSDVYEEEDYMKITKADIVEETDFLRKRRLERRHAVKEELIRSKALEQEKLKKKRLSIIMYNQGDKPRQQIKVASPKKEKS